MKTSNAITGKIFLLLLTLLLGMLASGQAPEIPKPVPIQEEPHHRLVFENSYVRVFRFSLPGHEATLLHAHDLPYVAVTLGAADFINAISGKPEAHGALADGQVGYSRGGFAHSVRTDSGSPFNNFTIELLKPQGEPRNLCQKITEGLLNDCPSGTADDLPGDSPLKQIAIAIHIKPLFETGEITVTSYTLTLKQEYSETNLDTSRLLVVEQDSEVRVQIAGESPRGVHGGEVSWLPAGKKWTIATPGTQKPARFLLIRFKDSESSSKP